MSTFERSRLDELALVPWLNGPNGQAWAGAVGRAQDAELVKLREGIAMRAPLDAPDDALTYLGRDRMLLQAPGESAALYRTRLDNAHNTWTWAGSRDGLVALFEPFLSAYGFTPATDTAPASSPYVKVYDIAKLGGAYWANGNGDFPWYSKVVIVIDSIRGPWVTDGTFASTGTFADEDLIGSSISAAELHYMRQMIRRLKAPGAYPVYIAVVLEGDGMIGYLPEASPTIGNDIGTFGDLHTDVFLRVGHAGGEGVLWGLSPDGTFGDSTGDFTNFED